MKRSASRKTTVYHAPCFIFAAAIMLCLSACGPSGEFAPSSLEAPENETGYDEPEGLMDSVTSYDIPSDAVVSIAVRNATDEDGAGEGIAWALMEKGYTRYEGYSVDALKASVSDVSYTQIVYSKENLKVLADDLFSELKLGELPDVPDGESDSSRVVFSPSSEDGYLYYSDILIIVGEDWLAR